jgi:hypothetical protein
MNDGRYLINDAYTLANMLGPWCFYMGSRDSWYCCCLRPQASHGRNLDYGEVLTRDFVQDLENTAALDDRHIMQLSRSVV